MQKGIYSDGSGFGELDIAEFLADRRIKVLQLVHFRFSVVMESPQGTIFSFGPVRLYIQSGRLKIAFGADFDDFVPLGADNCAAFPESVCDHKTHRIEVMMCFDAKCSHADKAQVRNRLIIEPRLHRNKAIGEQKWQPYSLGECYRLNDI